MNMIQCSQCEENKEESFFLNSRGICRTCRNLNARNYRLARIAHPSNHMAERGVWEGMKKRCLNPNSKDFKNYGGRGIRICDRWRYSFDNFLKDVGPRPSDKHWIERENNDIGYEPGNCVWKPRKDQMRNRSDTKWVDYQGSKISLSELSEITRLNYYTLKDRFDAGKVGNDLLKDPYEMESRKYKYNDNWYSISELSNLSGISESALYHRLVKLNMSVINAMDSSSTKLRLNRSLINRNKKVEYEGEEITLDQLSRLTGINIQTLIYRFKRGWRDSDLIRPVQGIRTYSYLGNPYTLTELSKISGVNPQTLFHRIYKQKMTIDEAMSCGSHSLKSDNMTP